MLKYMLQFLDMFNNVFSHNMKYFQNQPNFNGSKKLIVWIHHYIRNHAGIAIRPVSSYFIL